jgi:hypothetical protein
MGRVKAWYQEIVEREQDIRDGDYHMEIMYNQQSRRPFTVDEINTLAKEAAEMDRLAVDKA